MSKSANNSILFNPGVARVARAQFPNDVLTDDILAQMEGGKRRMADGRISFDDTPFNLALVKQTYPDIQIELPSKLIYPPLVKTTETEYPYTLVNKPAPFKTQIECLQKCKDFPAFLVAHDPGTGKTRIGIDKAGRHFARGEITGVLIITLKGIHRQWISQIPIYLGLSHGKQIAYQAFAWDGKKDPFTHAYRQGTMDWFAVTFGALGSNNGINAINNFTERHKHKLMIIVDESHCIKSFNSQRTEACYNLSFRACVRLALSGTPITKSIEDEWCQSLFLDERIFGYRYQSSFRAAYCEVLREGKNVSVIGHKNVDKFQSLMAPYVHRVKKEDALDLPPKIYERFVFSLKPDQRRHYDALKKNFLTKLNDGSTVTVQNAAVAMLRLQQISCGVLVDEDGARHALNDARMEALLELVQKFPPKTKIIIWCRFTADIHKGVSQFARLGTALSLFGETEEKERIKVKERFIEDPEVDWLFANPAVAGTGLDGFQKVCSTMIYHSNSFKSVDRWQSEDRIHRAGTRHTCNYIDLVAANTIDRKILQNLQDKKDLAAMALGDFTNIITGDENDGN